MAVARHASSHANRNEGPMTSKTGPPVAPAAGWHDAAPQLSDELLSRA
jgi:hypothetical protein